MKWNTMTRNISFAVIALLAALPLLAQAPKGWKVRTDRSAEAEDPDAAGAVKLAATGSGFHVTTPQAAVFWNPANTASGTYSLKGTFTLRGGWHVARQASQRPFDRHGRR
jgi:hypothetical protein